MGLFHRFTDIVSANLNDLVDRFEDPEKMLRQAIREMEAAVDSALQSAARVVANEKLLAKQLNEHRRQAEHWHGRARQAVADADEPLARRALVRKAEHEQLIPALEDQHTATQAAGRKLRRQLDGMRAKLSEAKRKLATLSARKRAADARLTLATVGTSDLPDAAFSKFDKMCQRVELAEAEADALAELRGFDDGDDELADDFAAEIDRQLAELKREAELAAY